MKLLTCLALAVLVGCADRGGSRPATPAPSDSPLNSIDSSAVINPSTRLPDDSTAMGVQH